MRVCFFGDSFVNGTGDDEGLGWVGRIVARARQSGADVTGYNLGIRGNTSADVAARWIGEARLRVRPELDGRLVFSFGTNDCASSETGGLPRVARSDAVAHAETILKAASDWLPTLMIGPGGLVGDRDGSHRIVALSADFAGLCARLGVPYFAICELTLGSPLWTHEVEAGDGAHPNSRGYALLAEVIDAWPAWREWVEGRRRS